MTKLYILSKLKAFAGNDFNVTQMVQFFFDRVENIVGERRKQMLPAFFPIPKMFSMGLLPGFVKSLDCVVKDEAVYDSLLFDPLFQGRIVLL